MAKAGLESSQTAEASARATLDARRASLLLLEHGNRPEDISIASAGVLQAQSGVLEAGSGVERMILRTRQFEGSKASAAQARAELALARVTLDRMTLKSSVGGRARGPTQATTCRRDKAPSRSLMPSRRGLPRTWRRPPPARFKLANL